MSAFANVRRNGSSGPHAHRIIARRKLKSDFAEALSLSGVVAQAAQDVGISKPYAWKLLGEIRAELGWQAV